ncbi:MAG TPA: type II toxin-antitoxin system RelE/ParE family toxin [Stellaceae bacterium]|nr:type II toxin-antitoxin system RelE/ParE family toxin [Stellaceae bacterium]
MGLGQGETETALASAVIALRWTDPALGDLEGVRAYLDEQAGPRVAASVVRSIVEASVSLTKFPHRGGPGRVRDTREIILAPYVIAYRLRGNLLEILRVLHGSRRWPARL